MSSVPASPPAWDVSARTPEGHVFRWRREAGGIVAQWVGLLTLQVDASGDVSIDPSPDADPALVEKLRTGTAAAFTRALDGLPSLHASAVREGERALVCLGASGAGKSTAAAELCRTPGRALLADDVTGLHRKEGAWWVLPTETSHWLASDGRGRKAPLPAPARASSPARLHAIAVLELDPTVQSAPHVERLAGTRVYTALVNAMLRFETDGELRVRELDWIAELARSVPVYAVCRGAATRPQDTATALAKLLSGEVLQ